MEETQVTDTVSVIRAYPAVRDGGNTGYRYSECDQSLPNPAVRDGENTDNR